MGIFSKYDPNLPSFVILETPLPAGTVADSLLAHVVADIRNPRYDFAPDGTTKELEGQTLEILDSDASMVRSNLASEQLQGRIGHLLSVGSQKSGNQSDSVNAAFVRTRTLQQHPKVLRKLVGAKSSHRAEVLQLLKRNKKGFMVTGFKTAVDGSRTRTFEKQRTVTFKAEVPANIAANAASHGAISLPADAVNPSLEQESKKESHAETSASMEGEQIFAVQYRPLKLRGVSSSNEPEFYGDILRDQSTAAVYGSDEDGEDAEIVMVDDEDPNEPGVVEEESFYDDEIEVGAILYDITNKASSFVG